MINGTLTFLRERIQNTHPRTRRALLNTLLGLINKGGGMLISLLLVPLTIDYLSTGVYGTWLTISSIVTMLTFLDIGIGNGLRNKFSEAVTINDIKLARTYVSTAYFIFGAVQLGFILIFIVAYQLIPWQRILNTTIDVEQLQLIILITVVAMAVKLVLDILSYILLALQESGQAGLINLLSNILILGGTYFLTRYADRNLVYLVILTVISPVIVMLLSGFVLYKKSLNAYRPSFSLVNFKHAKNLLALGYKFFFIQISVIILFYTDNLIITQLFGPSEVTTYNVAFRYFNSINTLFMIAITPYWSAFTEAFVKNDLEWMVRTYSYLQKLWLGLVVVVIIMTITASSIYNFWIGGRVTVPETLNIVMGLNVITICWNNVTVIVTNGLGKMKLQLYSSLFAAFLNIPLAIFLVKILNIGSGAVILASCISLWAGSILGSIQAKQLINGNAKGVWNK
ncbi:MATE family efflux transporter [Spirosoma jeollabukense]